MTSHDDYSHFIQTMDHAPGISPYYLPAMSRVQYPIHDLIWKLAGDEMPLHGKTVIYRAISTPILVLGYFCAFLTLPGDTILTWYPDGNAKQIRFSLLEITNLQPITIPQAAQKMDRDNLRIYYHGTPLVDFNIPYLNPGSHKVHVPRELKQLEEVLFFCSQQTGTEGWVSLYVLHPADNNITVLPQEWFNKGGYQNSFHIPARSVRDHKTKRIFAQGYRIGDFVMDESGRDVATWITKHQQHPDNQK